MHYVFKCISFTESINTGGGTRGRSGQPIPLNCGFTGRDSLNCTTGFRKQGWVTCCAGYPSKLHYNIIKKILSWNPFPCCKTKRDGSALLVTRSLRAWARFKHEGCRWAWVNPVQVTPLVDTMQTLILSAFHIEVKS